MDGLEGSELSPDFFRRDARIVARELLGKRVRSTVGGEPTEGVVVETEAYLGAEDPASHAATRGGATTRNAVMFGDPGRAYVYRSYGIHWCFNVVTGAPGDAQAVLVRGLEPLEGEEIMRRRRGCSDRLASGPGRLGQALGITGELNGQDLSRSPLQVLSGWRVPDPLVRVSGRVGIRVAQDWPFRFYIAASSGVSKVRAAAAGQAPEAAVSSSGLGS